MGTDKVLCTVEAGDLPWYADNSGVQTMPTATAEKPIVAKKKAGRPKGESSRGVGKPVRLDPDVVGKARVITGRRNLGDWTLPVGAAQSPDRS